MNRYKSRSGFAPLAIVTVILAVVLVGTLGYIFYQNYIQKSDDATKTEIVAKEDTNTTPTTNTKTTTASTDTSSTKGYLVFDDWGVKFKFPSGLGDNQIVYHKMNGDLGDYYVFSTSRVEALGDYCSSESTIGLGRFYRQTSRSTAEMSPPMLVGNLDGYYYYYVAPQSYCTDTAIEIQAQDQAVVQGFIKSIEKK